MNSRPIRKLSAAFLSAAVCATALAQVPLDSLFPEGPTYTGSERPPRYKVEVIVFAYRDFDPLEEDFEQPPPGTLVDLLVPNLLKTPPPDALDPADIMLNPLPEPGRYLPEALAVEPISLPPATDSPTVGSNAAQSAIAVDEFTAGPAPADQLRDDLSGAGMPSPQLAGDEPAPAEPEPLDEGWYRLLRGDELELGDTLARLERLDAYAPLVHGGWIQDGLGERDAIPLNLSRLGVFNPRGSIRLHLSRFLHVTVDLRFESSVGPRMPASVNAGPLPAVRFPPRYDLRVQRRVRSDELHFFDHPAFGVLIMVKPAPETPAVVEDALAPAA